MKILGKITIISTTLLLSVSYGAFQDALVVRDLKFHPRGVKVLAAAPKWGGVVMQAEIEFRSKDGVAIPPEDIKLALIGTNTVIAFGSTTNTLNLSVDTSIAIARWVSTGATGAFSYFDLDEEFVKQAGLVRDTYEFGLNGPTREEFEEVNRLVEELPPIEKRLVKMMLENEAEEGFVATEFHGTEISQILYDADFLDCYLLDFDDAQLLRNYSDGIASDMAESGDGSWVVTDIDSMLVARFGNAEISFTGTPNRYHYSEDEGKIHVSKIDKMADPNKLAQSPKSTVDTTLEQRHMAEVRENRAAAAKAIDLFCQVAIFRTMRGKNIVAWEEFCEKLEKEFGARIKRRLQYEDHLDSSK